MHTPFTDSYDKEFQLAAMMGPNAMRLAEELASFVPLKTGMRILDLGCGMGISSILLAEKFGATVFAADLWISPTENHHRFESVGLSNKIFPLSVDATQALPFAEEYFDAIFCVDSYQYFGANETMLPRLLPLLKPGGHIAVAACGVQEDFPAEVPPEMQPYWVPDMNFYPLSWWKRLWKDVPGLQLGPCREMESNRQAWSEWLQAPHPCAKRDIPMIEIEKGRYFAMIQLVGQKM